MRSDAKAKFRHELKFLISEGEKELLRQRMAILMRMDSHADGGGYMIRSLYFDDIWENAYEEKLAGTESRKKYRIRCYNASDAVIKLECKHKEGQYIHKVASSLTREETDRILAGDVEFMRESENVLKREFYTEWKCSLLRPKVIVDYEREPYVYPYGDVRITFDSHVRAGISDYRIFETKIPVLEVLEPGQLIMEVKFTEFLPNMIRDILPMADSIHTAASKYVMCMEKQKEYSGGRK